MLENLPKWWDEIKGYDEDHRPIKGTVLIIHLAGDDTETVSAGSILKHVLDIPIGHQTAATAMRLSTVMKQLGWQRHKNGYVSIPGYGRAKGYYRHVSEDDSYEKRALELQGDPESERRNILDAARQKEEDDFDLNYKAMKQKHAQDDLRRFSKPQA
jgi:hypothetical protein